MDKASKGFVKLDRTIFEHWIFQDAEKFKAFVDLIQLMRWKDETLVLGNKVVVIPRGSYYTSELKLSERWGWSRNKTRAYLNLLEKEHMLIKKGTAKGTTLTLANYEVYQGEGTTEGTSKGQQKVQHEVQQKEHQKDIKRYTKEEVKEREEFKELKEVKENNIIADDENFKSIRSVSDKWTSCGFGTLNKNLIDKLEADIEIYTIECVLEAIDIANEKGGRSYSYIKAILESWKTKGKDYKPKNNYGTKKNNFCDYKQRDYDFDDLEKKLLGWE